MGYVSACASMNISKYVSENCVYECFSVIKLNKNKSPERP